MYTPTRTPPQTYSENHPPNPHHHHTRRSYAHKFRESLTNRSSKCLCSYAHKFRESLTNRSSKCLCSYILIILIGVISFILWLSLRPHRPRFHVIAFSTPALNQKAGFRNAVISFAVTDRNPNRNIGIFYDSMYGEVYYREKRIGLKKREKLIGFTPLLFPFYQPPKNTTWIHGVMSGASLTVDDEYWKRFIADRDKGRVGFRLELTAVIHYKRSTWDTRQRRIHANCRLEVGSDGKILATWKHRRCRYT